MHLTPAMNTNEQAADEKPQEQSAGEKLEEQRAGEKLEEQGAGEKLEEQTAETKLEERTEDGELEEQGTSNKVDDHSGTKQPQNQAEGEKGQPAAAESGKSTEEEGNVKSLEEPVILQASGDGAADAEATESQKLSRSEIPAVVISQDDGSDGVQDDSAEDIIVESDMVLVQGVKESES